MTKKMCTKGCQCEKCERRRNTNRRSQANWRERHGKPRHTPTTWAQRFTKNKMEAENV